MELPCYPEFVPMTFALKDLMHPLLFQTPDGVSEYTFANLYLFRKRYNYQISLTRDKALIISGEREGKKFFMTPLGIPGRAILIGLFDTHDYWKGISDSILTQNQGLLAQWGIEIAEDRDNFDYLYLRTDLAGLPGKRYHKKRNLVNAFMYAYNREAGSLKQQALTKDLIPHALQVLDRWRQDKGADGDYVAAQEALECFASLGMQGAIYYVNGSPAGWCLGEPLARGTMFAVHFEKAIDEYKGIYQYMNQTFAASLPESIVSINREQDLGDEGLRQAKMTYRPSGFVRKYMGSFVMGTGDG
ncbi:MAG: phosphatidylglycerol lysyltransferase domain-containing protein [Treponema sp.]|nr:phosphatidylglycerol lysyltransferase domain-containing protein [Treponema sp.]